MYQKFFLFIFFCLIFENSSHAQQFKIVKITKTIKNPWGMSLINEKKLILTSKRGGIFFS